MVEVSDKFKRLAQENGRRVSCRVIADGVEFLDDTLTELTFDDVVHPDWFTVGTTCANRLHFTARYTGELSSGAEVRAEVSFDGEEWCPLGVFYISRRYLRGNYVSITAYDRMYTLDVGWSYSGALPVKSDDLLREICSEYGIECVEAGRSFTLEELPDNCTARDMIGYIAGINKACAKLDRKGRLTLKNHRNCEFFLSDSNCWQVQRNMGRSVVTCIKADTGDGVIQAGSGAQISTVEMYNPLMTQGIADEMLILFKPFSFYGAELHMQGMPFLEAGDSVYFVDGSNLTYIVLSEIEYTYNGGLSAVAYSKNKLYEEESGDLEELLQKLQHTKNAVYYRQVNTGRRITLDEGQQIVADFEFNTEEECFAQLDVNLTLTQDDGDMLIAGINVNGEDISRRIRNSITGKGYQLVHIYHLVEKLPAGKNRVYVTLQTNSGSAYISRGDLLATLVGHGIYGNAGSQRDKVALIDKPMKIELKLSGFGLLDISEEMSEEVT